MSLDKKLKIVLLRHGETVCNLQKRLQDDEDMLTENGKKQIASLNPFLASFKFDMCLSSNERRAIESAEIISSALGLNFQTSALIKEKCCGDFSGKLVSEVDWKIVGGGFFDKKIPGGESINDVIARARVFLNQINNLKQGESVLILSHGTFIRVLFCLIFERDIQEYILHYELPNASYIVLSRDSENRWQLEENNLVRKGDV